MLFLKYLVPTDHRPSHEARPLYDTAASTIAACGTRCNQIH